MATPINHVFVLMLENRSFDHIFGFSDITGTDAVTGAPTRANGLDAAAPPANPLPGNASVPASVGDAPFQLSAGNKDPGHEFSNTLVCLCGGGAWSAPNIDADGRLAGNAYPQAAPGLANSGFVANAVDGGSDAPGLVMRSFSREQLPVLNALAREFVLCDAWYSSLPGPTWPNRFFVHAASSAGLDDSPSNMATAEDFALGFDLPNGTIFDRLTSKGLDWKVIEGDAFPQVLAIKGMTAAEANGHFHDIDHLSEVINDPAFNAAYVFIEPDYDVLHNFQGGNSMHPLGDVRRGEQLIKTVYETLHASSVWDSSLLVVLFDEHGGFYDHVAPPVATPPGDTQPGSANNRHNFAFDRLGLRVPCIIASPWVGQNIIDHRPYDHSAIAKTLANLFDLGAPLTARDNAAQGFESLLLNAKRNTPDTLQNPAPGPLAATTATASGADASTAGFAQVALARHLSITPPAAQQAIVDNFNAAAGQPQATAAFLHAAHDAIMQWKQKGRPAPPATQP
ncbi:MAG: alkaline phosphatase family protein [Paludibacterium sp.]|uniref:alkaline phosphatase family protein n=1 Tax=Paludibacterium sp. TaxID=1917523 RepID=UPI0025F0E43D|nr:alkaline phosphatase family protein [Paludibacterium sp.]MBV8046472.1 alkaline phosphatase family protein [Paludibacterium sp.]